MAESNTTPSAEGLEKLLANPDLLRSIGSLMGAASSAETPPVDGLSRVLSDPTLMAKLPQVIEMIKPVLQNETPTTPPEAPSGESVPTIAHPGAPRRNCRDDLLLALKPFLSPERAAAIDTLLRLGQLGSVLQALK